MQSSLRYLRGKRLEALLAAVVGILLFLWHFPLLPGLSIWFALVFILSVYDVGLTRRWARQTYAFAKTYRLEIAFLCLAIGFLALWKFPGLFPVLAFFGCVLIVLGVNDNRLKRAAQKDFADILRRPLLGITVIVFSLLLLIWHVAFMAVLFFAIFSSFLLYDWDNRILAFCALFFLTACPFLLVFKQENLAETAAECAFFFLVVTVALQIIEFKRRPGKSKDEGV